LIFVDNDSFCPRKKNIVSFEALLVRPEVHNLSLTMYPFSISAEEHVPLKFSYDKTAVQNNKNPLKFQSNF